MEAHLDCLKFLVIFLGPCFLPGLEPVPEQFLGPSWFQIWHCFGTRDSSTSRLRMVYWCRGNDLSWGAMLYRVGNAPCTSYISRCGVRRVAVWGDGLRWFWLGSFSQHEVLFPSWGAFLGFWLFLWSWFVSRYRWFRPGLLWRWWLEVWRRFFSGLWSDFSFPFFLILWGRVRVREASIVMHIHPINMKLVRK